MMYNSNVYNNSNSYNSSNPLAGVLRKKGPLKASWSDDEEEHHVNNDYILEGHHESHIRESE